VTFSLNSFGVTFSLTYDRAQGRLLTYHMEGALNNRLQTGKQAPWRRGLSKLAMMPHGKPSLTVFISRLSY
jgi:hypothetical protein